MTRWAARLGLCARLTLAGLALPGCTDEAADLGHPPPIELATARRLLLVRLQDDPRLAADERARLDRAVSALAEGDAQAVRARVQAADPGDGETVRRALIASGVDPARITVEPSAVVARLTPVVALSRTFVHTTDCAAAIGPAWRGDPLPSLMSLGRCTQSNNLAAMLVDPADLAAPPALAPADGAYVVDGLRAWRAQRGAGLPSVVPDNAEPGPAGSGASGGGIPAAGAPAGAVVPATAPVVPASPAIPPGAGGATAAP